MKDNQPGRRLDQMLVDKGLVGSRSRARNLILRGFVLLNDTAEKRPSRKVGPDANLKISPEAPQFVSRGAEKLIAALDYFAYQPKGQSGLDIGSSTGGFTQGLLHRGAEGVVAVDVGSAQLHPHLCRDPRVRVFEQTDARQLTREMVGGSVGCLVIDVSFVSVIKIAPFVLDFVVPGGFAVVLVKPQFEVGSEHVGKGGVVRNAAVRDRAVARVHDWFAQQVSWTVDGVMQSPIAGGSGNIEYLLGARKLV